jgi:hypothetical protein
MAKAKVRLEGEDDGTEAMLKRVRAQIEATKKATNDLERASNTAGRSLKGATDDISKSARETEQRLAKVRQGAGALFGGIVNDADDVVGALGAIGPQAAAVVGSLAAIGGTVYVAARVAQGMYELAGSVDEANEELQDIYALGIDGFTAASEEAIDASARLNGQLESMADIGTQLQVIVGGRMAPAMADANGEIVQVGVGMLDLVDNGAKVVDKVNDITGGFGDWAAKMALMGGPLAYLAASTEGYSDDVALLEQRAAKQAEAEKKRAEVIEHARQAQERARYEQREADKADREAEREKAKADRAAEERARKAEERARQIAAAESDLVEITRKNIAITLDERGKIELQYEDEIRKIAELEKVSGDHEAADEARAAARLAADKQIADFEKKLAADKAKTEADTLKKVEAARKAAHDAEVERLEEEAERRREQTDAIIGAYSNVTSGVHDLLQAQVDAAEDGTAAQKQAAENALTAQKVLAVSEAIVQGEVAAVRALAELGPIAGGAVAVGIGLQTAAAISKIQAQEIKHQGGMVAAAPASGSREVTTTLKPEEGVLTSTGVRSIGGPRALHRANQGIPPGAGGGVLQIRYGHKVYGRFTKDANRLPGSPTRQAAKKGQRAGYSRRGR